MSAKQFRSMTTALAVCAALLASSAGRAEDDTALFSVNVPPNVLLVVDNSGSMNNMVWHPDFDPEATYSCNPECEPRITVGDGKVFFETTINQTMIRSGAAQAGAPK